jgi:hypothetical protein
MRSIGFRAETDLVHFAIVDGDPHSAVLLAHEKLLIQQECRRSDAFSILRTQLHSVFATHAPGIAAVRCSDRPKGQSHILSLFDRARIEGVILEACGSFGIPAIPAMSPTIKSGLHTKRAVKEYVVEETIREIDLSSIKNPNRREAIIVAISVLGGE